MRTRFFTAAAAAFLFWTSAALHAVAQDSAKKDSAKPDPAKANIAKPETAKAEAAKPETEKPIPPRGIEVAAADRTELEAGLAKLQEQITAIRGSKNQTAVSLLPDVEIFYRAVKDALDNQEFFRPQEITGAKDLVRIGQERAQQLAAGQSPWTTQTGPVVRGYVSRIDRSVQPYGLVIPASYPNGAPVRLDIWLHGRGETLSEVAFLLQRMKGGGNTPAPANTIVLHPYGRFCNANKFAGEVDVLEGMADVQRRYQIDEDRIAIRGFSMGGAGCWQFAVHYPDLWFAATPGAGFSETAEFLRLNRNKITTPPWETTLWRLYDCTGYAVNLTNCPTIAYSGEIDGQKQAADMMDAALQKEGITMTHIIGPKTGHSIHPESAREIERRLAALAVRGRERVPAKIQFVTFTLKYNRQNWVTVNGLEKHWEQARVDAEIVDNKSIRVNTKNVTGLTLAFEAGWCPFDPQKPVMVRINNQDFEGPRPQTDRSWTFHWWQGKAQPSAEPAEAGLYKKHDLQGPIDDAFMEYFVIVKPTGKGQNATADAWARSEADHLVKEWRRQFRGYATVKNDTEVTDEDIATANLILFGDPGSNAVLGKIAPQLPIRWTEQTVSLGKQSWDAANHAPVFIYPNPLNSKRYVVVNSGFTFREYDYLNNARQIPKLPDWAVIDLRTKPNSRYAGQIVTAGFFGEKWEPLAQ